MSTHAEISALRAQVADLAAENARLREMNALLLENRALRGAVAPTPMVVPPVPLDAPSPAFRAKCSEYGRLYKDCRAAYEKLSRSARAGARFPRYVQCETDTDTEKAMCRLREFARSLNLAAESDGFTPVRRRRRRGGRGRARGTDASPAPSAAEPIRRGNRRPARRAGCAARRAGCAARRAGCAAPRRARCAAPRDWLKHRVPRAQAGPQGGAQGGAQGGNRRALTGRHEASCASRDFGRKGVRGPDEGDGLGVARGRVLG